MTTEESQRSSLETGLISRRYNLIFLFLCKYVNSVKYGYQMTWLYEPLFWKSNQIYVPCYGRYSDCKFILVWQTCIKRNDASVINSTQWILLPDMIYPLLVLSTFLLWWMAISVLQVFLSFFSWNEYNILWLDVGFQWTSSGQEISSGNWGDQPIIAYHSIMECTKNEASKYNIYSLVQDCSNS